jgi:hypothetical protein
MCHIFSLPSASLPSGVATSHSGYSVVGHKESGERNGQSSLQQGQFKMFKCSLCWDGVLENLRLPPLESRAKFVADFGATSRL